MRVVDLVGYQLVSINETEIVVKQNRKVFTLHIKEDEGDCCGYNDIETSLFIDKEDLTRNPVITKVEMSLEDNDDWDGQKCKITFFGESKPIAELNTHSSSGSGWCYGACVSLICDDIELNETLSAW